MSLICCPLMVHDVERALGEARAARDLGADLVEFRLDEFFHGGDRPLDGAADGSPGGSGHGGSSDSGQDEGDGLLPALDTLEAQIAAACDLVSRSPLACIATCRPTWEGGFYDGPEDARIALFEALGTLAPPRGHPPRYIDVELSAYARSANIRQKVHLAVDHPLRGRDLAPSLILSLHDFKGPPADLSRRLLAARDAEAARVIKVAFHARSLRDNLELFDILGDRDRPTIALGMGEFGLISRVLAPKFGGFLTFASLRSATTTAPGQPTIADLVGTYRFRSIMPGTRVYGIVGWPEGHSLSPAVHNAGFESVGHDGVYVPLPIAADARTGRDEPELAPTGASVTRAVGTSPKASGGEGGGQPLDASYISFKATLLALIEHPRLDFSGCSVTIPHKQNLVRLAKERGWAVDALSRLCGAANTLVVDRDRGGPVRACRVMNTDGQAATACLERVVGSLTGVQIGIVGAGGAARAIAGACVSAGANVSVYARRPEAARTLVGDLRAAMTRMDGLGGSGAPSPEWASGPSGGLLGCELDAIKLSPPTIIINATPVGMSTGSDPGASPLPVADIARERPDTVFFDTVYRPLETPMLDAARRAGCRVIDGLEMFTRQATEQFAAWTGRRAPVALFDRIARELLGRGA